MEGELQGKERRCLLVHGSEFVALFLSLYAKKTALSLGYLPSNWIVYITKGNRFIVDMESTRFTTNRTNLV